MDKNISEEYWNLVTSIANCPSLKWNYFIQVFKKFIRDNNNIIISKN